MSDEKIAVVLFSMGGPSSLKEVKPFLFNLFMDKNILNIIWPVRYFLAKYISFKRGRDEALKTYKLIGGKSPLLENTKVQAEVLEKALNKKTKNEFKVYVAMRYWHPFVKETIKEIKKFNPQKIVLLPMYPQYSTTTSKSSLEDWYKHFKKQIPLCEISSFQTDEGFINASVDLIKKEIKKAPKKIRILFSAHGLPKKIIEKGDPYKKQCEQTTRTIVEKLRQPELDWSICYQSKVGSLEWIGPSIKQEIERAAGDKVGLIIYPISFVSEHVETFVELDIKYSILAKHLGIEFFKRIPTVSTHPKFIKGLRDLILLRLQIRESSGNCSESDGELKNG